MRDPIPMFEGVPFLPAGLASAIFIGMIVLAVAILYGMKKAGRALDHDLGPAKGTKYPRKDKWSRWHLIASAIIALFGVVLGAPWWVVLVFTMLAGIAWEVIHGYVDWHGDVLTWNLGGTVGGILLGVLLSAAL